MLQAKYLLQNLEEFSNSTTMHGLTNINRHKSIPGKICWILFLWLAFGIWMILLGGIFETFLEYSYDQIAEYKKVPSFPDVTFCPFGPVYPNNLYDPNSTEQHNQYWYLLENDLFDDYFHKNNINFSKIRSAFMMDSSEAKFSNLNNKTREQIKRTYESTFITCDFNISHCDKNDFHSVWHTLYLNCLSLSKPTKEIISFDNAFQAVIYLGSPLQYERKATHNFLPYHAYSAVGLKVSFHETGTQATSMGDGFNLAAGTSTEIYISQHGLKENNPIEQYMWQHYLGLCVQLRQLVVQFPLTISTGPFLNFNSRFTELSVLQLGFWSGSHIAVFKKVISKLKTYNNSTIF